MEEQGLPPMPVEPQRLDPALFETEVKNIAIEDPKTFKSDLLTSLEEIDPQVVAEFKAELSQMSLSAEVINALQTMVDEILASPEKYEEIRAKYLAQEVPEELLPAMFDPTFFGGLELALNELEKNLNQPVMPMPMAEGGIATVAQAIARMGRRGDTMLAHITPEEAAILQRMGGSGTINPVTGLPEFFLKKIFKSAKSVLKGVGKAVNKIAKSDVGRIALTIAASYYMGPAGFNIGASTFTGATLTGIQTAAGSTLVSLAAGDSLKDSLKSGITAGLTAGFGQAFSSALPETGRFGKLLGPRSDPGFLRSGIGGALAGTGVGLARGQNLSEALKSGIGGAAQSAGRQLLMTPFEKLEGKLGSKLPFLDAISKSRFATQPTGTKDPLGYLVEGTGKRIGAVGDLFSMGEQDPATTIDKSFTPEEAEQAAIRNYRLQNPRDKNFSDEQILNILRPENFKDFFEDQKQSFKEKTSPFFSSLLEIPGAVVSAPIAGGKYLYDKSGQLIKDIRSGYTRNQPFPEDYATFGEKIGRSADVAGEKIAEYLPGDTRRAELAANIRKRAEDEFNEKVKIIENTPDITSEEIAAETAKARSEMIAAKAMEPGIFSMYGPAALGLGALAYAGGAFDTPEEEVDFAFDPYYTGMDYIRDNPQLFAGRFRGYTPYLYAKGGIAQEFPRKTGAINGPGTGTSDSIPAMLSDGEFVMTAKAVRNMGGGSRRKGAAKMYKMMKELEKRAA